MNINARRLAATRVAGLLLFVALGVMSLGTTATHHMAHHPRGHGADPIVSCGVRCVPDISTPQKQQDQQPGHAKPVV